MRTSKAAIAAILAGAVALASAAYGIGTQSGDGTAAARDDGERGSRSGGAWQLPPPPGFEDLAEELGVDEDELRDALADFHEREDAERRDTFAGALAEALGKPVEEVRAALDEVGPDEGMRPGCAPDVSLRRLAAELDVTGSELREALRETRAGVDSSFEKDREDLVAFLADRLGLSEDEVEEALPEWPRFKPRLEWHGPGAVPPLGSDGRPRLGPGGPPRFLPDGLPG
jgi:hypothetical protein